MIRFLGGASGPVWPLTGDTYLVREARRISLLSPSGEVLARSGESEIRVVQLNEPQVGGVPISLYCGRGFGFSSVSDITLLEVVRPPGLSLALEGDPSGLPGEDVDITLPFELKAGQTVWSRVNGIYYNSLTPIIIYKAGDEIYYVAPGAASGSGQAEPFEWQKIREIYELGGEEAGGKDGSSPP